MTIGGVVKLVTNYILIGIPSIAINGAPIGTICCYATIAIINIVFVYKKTELGPRQWWQLWKPLAAALVMGVFAHFAYPALAGMLGARLGVCVVLLGCIVLYFLMLWVIGGFNREDILMLPKGKKLARLLRLK